MTPLHSRFGGGGFVGWRLGLAIHAPIWETGEGAFRVGSRWNSQGVRAVYASLGPATAILEVAVHKGFRVLDTVPDVLTSFEVTDPAGVYVVLPDDVPNANWLRPTTPGAGQQRFGEALLAAHRMLVLPSAATTQSWNLVFVAAGATGSFRLLAQEPFALDPRFHPISP